MILLLLEAFDRERPRGRLVLVLLSKFMDIRTVPVPLLSMGGGGRTDRSISRSFRGSVLAVLLSTQSTKGSLLLIITRTRWRKVVCGELPESEVERRARTKVSQTTVGRQDTSWLGITGTHPIASIAPGGAILFTSSNSAANCGSH